MIKITYINKDRKYIEIRENVPEKRAFHGWRRKKNEETKPLFCDRCWMMKSLRNGSCGCEEQQ